MDSGIVLMLTVHETFAFTASASSQMCLFEEYLSNICPITSRIAFWVPSEKSKENRIKV